MSIFAIGDLHLAGSVDKPMDKFGPHWTGHWDRIQEDWTSRVTESDIVLIPGDISWAMQLDEAVTDLNAIGRLPGMKILIRGNHDYWWSSLSKVRSILPPTVHALQNDSITIYGYTFCGTRGWTNPDTKDFGEHDLKIYNRELQRLKLSLEKAGADNNLIVLMHYPPFGDRGQETGFVQTISQYRPMHVVYGHLHGEGARYAYEGTHKGTQYHLVACDHLGFRLKKIL